MLEALGNEVIYLKRISIEGIKIGNLKLGELKSIQRDEIKAKVGPKIQE